MAEKLRKEVAERQAAELANAAAAADGAGDGGASDNGAAGDGGLGAAKPPRKEKDSARRKEFGTPKEYVAFVVPISLVSLVKLGRRQLDRATLVQVSNHSRHSYSFTTNHPNA